MRKDGLVTAEWVADDSGPPRKYYTVTELGADTLDAMREIWRRMDEVLLAQHAKEAS